MLEPLDSEKLDALLRDDDDAGCDKISAARYLFEKKDLAQGMEALLQAFGVFNPYLFYEEHDGVRNWRKWHIKFYEAPFDRLRIQPCGHTIEIFQRDRFAIAFGIIGEPRSWVRTLQWLWAYGEETYAKNVKNGSMVRPLEPCKLAALAHAESSNDCDFVKCTKVYLSEEKDLAAGVLCLFEGWDIFAPRLHRDKEHYEKWHLTFRNSPFRSLRIQPSADRGIVDVCAFKEKVASFHIIDNPEVTDPQMWQRLLRWTWDYGRRRLVHKQQWEASQRTVPKAHAKPQRRPKRTEKPLLRKVLNTAGFKAQYGASSKGKDVKHVSGNDNVTMEDVDLPKDVEQQVPKTAKEISTEKPLSRQPFTQKLPLGQTDPNAQLSPVWNPKVVRDGHTREPEVEDVNAGSLEVIDQQR